MYSNKIFEIFKNPANAGGLQGSNGIGKYIDESCGDFVKLYLKIDDNLKITEARFKTMGGVGTIVASSVLCDIIAGMTLQQAQAVTADDILAITGDYPQSKMYSLDFVFRSLNLAIADYYEKLEKDDKKSKKSKKQSVANLDESSFDEIDSNIEQNTPSQETLQEDAYQQEIKVYMDEEKPSSEQLSAFDIQNIESDSVAGSQNDNDGDYADYEDGSTTDIEEHTQTLNDNNEYTFEAQSTQKQASNPDPVDIFLYGTQDEPSGNAFENVAIDQVLISKTTEETINIRATRMVEESKNFAPVVETKILTDEELEKLNLSNKSDEQNELEEESKKSKAKAIFDSMFEE